jgi:hypothetical protein
MHWKAFYSEFLATKKSSVFSGCQKITHKELLPIVEGCTMNHLAYPKCTYRTVDDPYKRHFCLTGLLEEYDSAVLGILKPWKKWPLPIHLVFPNGYLFPGKPPAASCA